MRFGQCHVRRWTDEILPLVLDDADVLGVRDLATHRAAARGGARTAYEMFQKKAGRLREGGPQAVSGPTRPAWCW